MNAGNIARLHSKNIDLSTHATGPPLNKTDRAECTYALGRSSGQYEERRIIILVCC